MGYVTGENAAAGRKENDGQSVEITPPRAFAHCVRSCRCGGRFGDLTGDNEIFWLQMYKSPVTESQGLSTLIRADTCWESDVEI